MSSATPATTRNTKNRIFAIDAAPAAITGEAEECCDERDDEKYEGVSEHGPR